MGCEYASSLSSHRLSLLLLLLLLTFPLPALIERKREISISLYHPQGDQFQLAASLTPPSSFAVNSAETVHRLACSLLCRICPFPICSLNHRSWSSSMCFAYLPSRAPWPHLRANFPTLPSAAGFLLASLPKSCFAQQIDLARLSLIEQPTLSNG